jgi:hypothetical protein
MTVSAEDINAFLDDCHQKWKNRTQPQTVPKILYHYTTAHVFREILATGGTFWASDIRYMNDASEVTYASDILKSVIKDGMEAVHESDERELLERIAKTFDVTETLNIFALCFSEDDDSLPQWIAYAGRRGGFAMGIRFGPFIRAQHAAKDKPELDQELVKIAYDTDTLRSLSTDFIHGVMTLYRCARDQVEERLRTLVMADLCQASRRAFFYLLLSFKHPVFKHEQEWRLVFPVYRWEKGGAEFRVGATGLVPYLPIQLTETAYIPPPAEVLQGLPAEARALLERHAEVLQGLPAEARAWLERPCPPLAEVVQGPTAERALARDALERFLRGLGHDAKTRLSEAPLR